LKVSLPPSPTAASSVLLVHAKLPQHAPPTHYK
jgi:hypothetical protein